MVIQLKCLVVRRRQALSTLQALVDGTLLVLGAWMGSNRWILGIWMLVIGIFVSMLRGLGSIPVVLLIR